MAHHHDRLREALTLKRRPRAASCLISHAAPSPSAPPSPSATPADSTPLLIAAAWALQLHLDLDHMGMGGDDSWSHLRTVAETKINDPSSRSHAMCTGSFPILLRCATAAGQARSMWW